MTAWWSSYRRGPVPGWSAQGIHMCALTACPAGMVYSSLWEYPPSTFQTRTSWSVSFTHLFTFVTPANIRSHPHVVKDLLLCFSTQNCCSGSPHSQPNRLHRMYLSRMGA